MHITLKRLLTAATAACIFLTAARASAQQKEVPPANPSAKTETNVTTDASLLFMDALTIKAVVNHLDELRASIAGTRKVLARRYGDDPVKYSQARAALCMALFRSDIQLGLEEFESLDADAAASDSASLNGCRLFAAQVYFGKARLAPLRNALQKVADDPTAAPDYIGYAKLTLALAGAGAKGPGEPYATLQATIPPIERTRDVRFAALYKVLVTATSGDDKLFTQSLINAYAVLSQSPDPDLGTQVDNLSWAAATLGAQALTEKALEAATRAEELAKQLPKEDPRLMRARTLRAKILKIRHADEELKAYGDVNADQKFEATFGMAVTLRPDAGLVTAVDIRVLANIEKAKTP